MVDGKIRTHRGQKYHAYSIYGASTSVVKEIVYEVGQGDDVDKLTTTRCCGSVAVVDEMMSGDLVYCDGGGLSSTDECGIFLLIIIALMAVFAIVWAAVMIVFSIFTLGGFVRRRYRTLLMIEQPRRNLLLNVAFGVAFRGGVMDWDTGIPEYDEWKEKALSHYRALKYVRQISFLFGIIWGMNEIYNKALNLLDPNYHYNLWPFRLMMVIIFLPLLFACPVIELRMRELYRTADPMFQSILADDPDIEQDLFDERAGDQRRGWNESDSDSPFMDRI